MFDMRCLVQDNKIKYTKISSNKNVAPTIKMLATSVRCLLQGKHYLECFCMKTDAAH